MIKETHAIILKGNVRLLARAFVGYLDTFSTICVMERKAKEHMKALQWSTMEWVIVLHGRQTLICKRIDRDEAVYEALCAFYNQATAEKYIGVLRNGS